MKVFLLGATGNLGSRLVAALLTHGHGVVAYVRSPQKLESLLPASIYEQIIVIQGDAMDSISIKQAILDSNCNAVVTAAGVAKMFPWQTSDLPQIFKATLDAVREVGIEQGQPLRTWFLGGLGVLSHPKTDSMLSNYLPIFPQHIQNISLLKSLPPNTIDWSMLCPGTLLPESSELSVPLKSTQGKLVASAATPPLWQTYWIESIPIIGTFLSVIMNAVHYNTTLEQNADFIAEDLEVRDSRWIGTTVGVIGASR